MGHRRAVGRCSGGVPPHGRPAHSWTPRARGVGIVALLHVSAARTVTSPLLNVAPEDAAAVLVIVPAAAPILLGTLLLLASALVCATLAAPDLRRAWLAHDADARVAAIHPFRSSPPALLPASSDADLQACCLPHTISDGLTARASRDLQHSGADGRS